MQMIFRSRLICRLKKNLQTSIYTYGQSFVRFMLYSWVSTRHTILKKIPHSLDREDDQDFMIYYQTYSKSARDFQYHVSTISPPIHLQSDSYSIHIISIQCDVYNKSGVFRVLLLVLNYPMNRDAQQNWIFEQDLIRYPVKTIF